MDKEIIKKIMSKKEFSEIPEEDVKRVFRIFEKRQTTDEDKIKLTRDLLRKIYSVFTSTKLLNKKIIDKKTTDEILKKHFSTKERYGYYAELYKEIFSFLKEREISVIDLGAGINGLSYEFFPKTKNINYIGVEAVGQLSNLANFYFAKEKIDNKARVFHESLFNTEWVKEIINKSRRPRVIFLFKIIDSLEIVERNYSKKFLNEIASLADLIIVSFAMRSLVSGKKFSVKRYWFENFAKGNFEILKDFELGSERYIIFKKR